jgi:hypothetical protein
MVGCQRTQTTQPNQPGSLDSNASFSQIHALVIMTNCALSGCHGATGTQPTAKPQNLSTPALAIMALVGVQSIAEPQFLRVNPTKPDSSELVRKLEGTSQGGLAMPPGGRLPPNVLMAIRNWILRGAPND